MTDNKLVKRDRVRIPDEILPAEDEGEPWSDYTTTDMAKIGMQKLLTMGLSEIALRYHGLSAELVEYLLPEGYELCYDNDTRYFHIRKRPSLK